MTGTLNTGSAPRTGMAGALPRFSGFSRASVSYRTFPSEVDFSFHFVCCAAVPHAVECGGLVDSIPTELLSLGARRVLNQEISSRFHFGFAASDRDAARLLAVIRDVLSSGTLSHLRCIFRECITALSLFRRVTYGASHATRRCAMH